MPRSIGEILTKVVRATTLMLALVLTLAVGPAANAQVRSFAVVPNNADGTVTLIDTTFGPVGTSPFLGGSPFCAAVTPDGRQAWFTDVGHNTVTRLDVATNTTGPAIPVGNVPHSLAIAPDGGHVYVANMISSDVSIIDTTTNAVTTIPLSFAFPTAIAVAPDGLTAYVTEVGGIVSVLDLTHGTEVLPPISLGAGAGPAALAVTPDGAAVYVANSGNNTVSVIRTSDNTVTTTVTLPAGSPQGIAVTPDGQTVYVLDNTNNLVRRINVSDNTLLASTFAVGTQPTSGANFMSPAYIVLGAGPLSVANDTELKNALFGSPFVNFAGGVLALANSFSTDRTVSVLSPGGLIDTNGHDLTLTHGTIGDGMLTKQTIGTLILAASATASHAGGTQITGGTLEVDGSHTSDITIANSGTLTGNGSVGHVSGTGTNATATRMP
jgi:YVTN family beta-propeller protein/autotransporter-associated beta strand protein